jgi:hypothetical protein
MMALALGLLFTLAVLGLVLAPCFRPARSPAGSASETPR